MSCRPTKCCGYAGLMLALFAAWFSGCAVGPNYKRPKVDSPAVFRDDNAVTNSSFADLDWWQVYRDDSLQALVREALTNNFDLRIAVTQVDQAREVAMQARSQFVPNVSYNGVLSRGRNDLFGSGFPNNAAVLNSVSTSLNASWELDFWGRIRRLNESARAQFLASGEARRAVTLSLVGDVAQAWFELLELDREYEIATRTTNSFAESLRIFSQRFEGGVVLCDPPM